MYPIRNLLLASLLALAATLVAAEQPQVEPAADLTATFVANEGFLLEAGGRKVLVDALFGNYPLYIDISPQTRAAVVAGEGAFADIDLILATHYHADHFDAGAVARFLAANPKANFVSTPQAVAKLEAQAGYDGFKNRVKAVLPKEGQRIRLPELGLEVLNLHHGRNRRPRVENLGFVIHLGGFKVLHVGDTMATKEEFAAYDLPKDGIDLAMMADWHLLYDTWAGVVDQAIRPRHVLAMHFQLDSDEDHFAKLRKAAPGVVLLRNELETHTFPSPPG